MGRRRICILLLWATLIGVAAALPVRGALANTVGDFEVTGGQQGSGNDYSFLSPTLTVRTGTALTIEMAGGKTSTTNHIKINDGVTANITIKGLTVAPGNYMAIEVGAGATINLTLSGTNTFTGGRTAGGKGRAAIYVPADASLTIKSVDGTANHKLIATGDRRGAGIGGGWGQGKDGNANTGTIRITGGTVTAESYGYGTVVPYGKAGAGIGAGFSDGAGYDGGTIEISGGTVVANSSDSAGIGGAGGFYNNGGDGGTVVARGHENAKDIGHGLNYQSGGSASVVISGGSVSTSPLLTSRIAPSPVNATGLPVYGLNAELLEAAASQKVTAVQTSPILGAYGLTYGINDIWLDSAKMFYPWLPNGESMLTAVCGGDTYRNDCNTARIASTTAENSGKLSKSSLAITLSPDSSTGEMSFTKGMAGKSYQLGAGYTGQRTVAWEMTGLENRPFQGIDYDATTRTFSGTPTAAGSKTGIVATANDGILRASRTVSIRIGSYAAVTASLNQSSPVMIPETGGSSSLTLNVANIQAGASSVMWTVTELMDDDHILTLPAGTSGTLSNNAALPLGTFTVAANPPAGASKTAKVRFTFTGGVEYESLPAPIDVVFTLEQSTQLHITGNSVDAQTVEGAPASFRVSAWSYYTPLTYLWQVNRNDGRGWASDLVNNNAATYTIPNTTLTQNGYRYRCIVRDAKPGGGDEVISDPVTLTVMPFSIPETGDPSAFELFLGLALAAFIGHMAISRRKRT